MAYFISNSYKLKIDPCRIFESLYSRPNCFFLDSSLSSPQSARFSFFGSDPYLILQTRGKEPFTLLRSHLENCRLRNEKNAPPFLGGAVGFLAYDLGLVLEKKIRTKKKVELGVPHSFFGFYNTVIIIDHWKKNLWLCASGFPERKTHFSRLLAAENFKKIKNLVSQAAGCREKTTPRPSVAACESNFTREGYIKAVKRAQDYIGRGDIYQVNLSQQFHSRTELSGLEIYRRLRQVNAASFNAYLNTGCEEILSSSPEEFLTLSGSIAVTKPMKGTRPRGRHKKEDLFFRKNLLQSPKDKAELLMIVDLERNDLGKVCDYGSIKVPVLRSLEKYNTLYQTTSTVEGRLYKDKDSLNLLEACFPGGSITGCPKIRAMEIIEELEPDRRSVYTGSLGYLSFSGNMNFNILIRTLLKKGNDVYFGAGGGIVADSDPASEYDETLVKAKGMFYALGAPLGRA